MEDATDHVKAMPASESMRGARIGSWLRRLVGWMVLPLVCTSYFCSEAVVRRQCYDLVTGDADEGLRRDMLNQLPAFVRRPMEESLARADAEAAVAVAPTSQEKCARLRDLLGLVSADDALPIHQKIVSLCPHAAESAASWIALLQSQPAEVAVGEYLEYVRQLGERGLGRGKQQEAWMQGMHLSGSDDDLFLDFTARALLERWVAPGLGEPYRRLQRLASKRGHHDAAELASQLAEKCDEAALREMEKARRDQLRGAE